MKAFVLIIAFTVDAIANPTSFLRRQQPRDCQCDLNPPNRRPVVHGPPTFNHAVSKMSLFNGLLLTDCFCNSANAECLRERYRVGTACWVQGLTITHLNQAGTVVSFKKRKTSCNMIKFLTVTNFDGMIRPLGPAHANRHIWAAGLKLT